MRHPRRNVAVCCMCCRVLPCVAVHCSALQCVAVCCSVLRCVAVCCNVLQSATGVAREVASFYSCIRRVRECDMSHSGVWHKLSTCVTGHIHMRDTTHSYMWHDSFTCLTWIMYLCDAFICVTWLLPVCDVTHSYVYRDSFICVSGQGRLIFSSAWHVLERDVTLSCVWHCAFKCVTCHNFCGTWHVRERDVTHLYVWHNLFMCVTRLFHAWNLTEPLSFTHKRAYTCVCV